MRGGRGAEALGVTMLTGHDLAGVGEVQQGDSCLKEAGSVWPHSSINTSLVSVLRLTQLDLFLFPSRL